MINSSINRIINPRRGDTLNGVRATLTSEIEYEMVTPMHVEILCFGSRELK